MGPKVFEPLKFACITCDTSCWFLFQVVFRCDRNKKKQAYCDNKWTSDVSDVFLLPDGNHANILVPNLVSDKY